MIKSIYRMSLLNKLSFPLIINWFCNMIIMRRTCRDFVIYWIWPRILVCLSYYEHKRAVYMLC